MVLSPQLFAFASLDSQLQLFLYANLLNQVDQHKGLETTA
jgi:hypothetical protein